MDPNLFKKIFIFVLVSYWYTCLYLLVPEGHIFCGLCLQSLPNWFSAPVANNDQEPELFITSLVCTYVPNYGYGEIWDFKNKELGGIPVDFIRTLSLSTSSFDVSFSSELWPKKKTNKKKTLHRDEIILISLPSLVCREKLSEKMPPNHHFGFW